MGLLKTSTINIKRISADRIQGSQKDWSIERNEEYQVWNKLRLNILFPFIFYSSKKVTDCLKQYEDQCSVCL